MSIQYEVQNESRNKMVTRCTDFEIAKLHYEDSVKKHTGNVFSIYEVQGADRKKVM